ncbi:5095_t:CDS:2, partial [Scutellospora calospora]
TSLIEHLSDYEDNVENHLSVGNLFNDWDYVQAIVDSFAKQNGFVANKNHKDLDPVDKSIVRQYTYNCWKAGTYQPKKVKDINLHYNSSLSKTNCKLEV